MADAHDPIRIFYCYAPQDRKICDEIENFFKSQIDKKAIEIWADHHVLAGENPKQEVRKRLLQADIVLIMVSPDFLASDYLNSEEMELALRRKQEDKTKIIPILLRPCDLQASPLGEIKALSDRPITSERKRDQALLFLTQKLQKVVEEVKMRKRLRKSSALSSSSYPSSPELLDDNLTIADIGKRFIVSGVAGRNIEVQLLPQTQKLHASTSSQRSFCCNIVLPEPGEFFGRASEWRFLLNRCRGKASTSIIGPHGSGKTWLLQRLSLEATNVLDAEYRVGYIDAYLPSCSTVQGFVRLVLDALGIQIITPVEQYNMILLERVMKALTESMQHFVLCIDKIDKLYNEQEFDTHFLGQLRALAMVKALILVTTSKLSLFEVFGKTNRTSDFFNIFESCEMEPFSEGEAQTFLNVKGGRVGLTRQEQDELLLVSQLPTGWYPVRLQLAGSLFLIEKDSGIYRNVESDEYWEGFKQRLNEKYKQIKGPV